MAIIGTKPTGLIKTVGELATTGGVPTRTGLIWWLFNGVAGIESSALQPALNRAAQVLGHGALADKSVARTLAVATNDRENITP